MCGIAGRFHPGGLPDAGDWHERADRLLAHRGPDGRGHYRDERCELIHRRLAIVDLSPTGHQPMPNETGSVLVVFNGEIYNHRELRADLERRGHRFRGTADTEVLVHLYEDLGPAMVDRLRGMFAFALYDRAAASLLLARDRFGIKPLYYTRTASGTWIFASELKAIAAAPDFRGRVDRQACSDFLTFGYVPEPATGFAGVSALEPGRTLVVGDGGAALRTYHAIEARPDPDRSAASLVDLVEAALLDATGRQSVADVPVAALLSGGIDSSLVVAAHRRATAEAATTFNVRFPDPRYDETAMAESVSAHCRTNHHTVDLAPSLTTDSIFDLLRHFDQPFADLSLFPTHWVSAAIRDRGIVCVLSGDGGDEAFGGYARFWRANRIVRLVQAPPWVRRLGVRAGLALAPRTRNLGRQVAKAARMAEAARLDPAVLLAGFASYLDEQQKADLVVAEALAGLAPSHRLFATARTNGNGHADGAIGLEDLSRRITETLFSVGLPSDMLRKVDMMSMRAGIEVRVPLLDERVVELGLTLPHRLKTNGRNGKLVLRALARRWLPGEVARHPKHGFAIPIDRMLPADFHPAARDLLLGPDSRTAPFLAPGPVAQWLGAFAMASRSERRTGGVVSRGGLAQRVFMTLALELWLRQYRLTW